MWNILIGAALAVGGYVFADAVVADVTGKHIHEHIFKWWCEMRDQLTNWLSKNGRRRINRIALVVLDKLDSMAVRTKKRADKITLGMYGHNKSKKYEIMTREVSKKEAIKMFPDLRNGPVLVMEL